MDVLPLMDVEILNREARKLQLKVSAYLQKHWLMTSVDKSVELFLQWLLAQTSYHQQETRTYHDSWCELDTEAGKWIWTSSPNNPAPHDTCGLSKHRIRSDIKFRTCNKIKETLSLGCASLHFACQIPVQILRYLGKLTNYNDLGKQYGPGKDISWCTTSIWTCAFYYGLPYTGKTSWGRNQRQHKELCRFPLFGHSWCWFRVNCLPWPLPKSPKSACWSMLSKWTVESCNWVTKSNESLRTLT